GDSSKYSVSAGYWKLNDSGSALDKSSTQFEAGQTYTLYLTYYPEDGYNIPDDATYTVNGIPTEWSGFEAESNRKISFTIPAVTTYTVTFDANGGTGTMTAATVESGAEYTLPANGFTAPAGKQFKAWSVGGVEKAVGDKITVTGETIIYAVWIEKAPTPPPETTKFGDVNGDGTIDTKDAVLLAQYLAKWSVTVSEAAADCNNDGIIDTKDAVLLAQYLAKWDVTLG
ncbi:MAG: InlB B-repeat-containing protein, partial [Clostridia bacterium]|nr:InlB B-repeat-containing protein [Clostridia bacterium]